MKLFLCLYFCAITGIALSQSAIDKFQLPVHDTSGVHILSASAPQLLAEPIVPFFSYQRVAGSRVSLFNSSQKPLLQLPSHTVTGLFCRFEHQIEKRNGFAPRFRLGSVEYTDWMEGKRDPHAGN